MFNSEQLADNVTIYCGDCREVIPSIEKIDAVISDPPYGIEELVGGYSRFPGSDHNIANDKDLDCMEEMLKLVKQKFNNIWVAAFYSPRITREFFRVTAELDYFGELVWDKKILGLGNDIRYQHENIGVFKIGEPERVVPSSSVITFVRVGSERSVHPHEKPTQLMNKVCSIIPGKIIFDPFMGTGTTGAAAVQLNRGFVGIELDPKYFDLARKKISEALKQPMAFWE